MPKITIPVLPMHPVQQAIDASPARYKVINCGRPFGKTLSSLEWLLSGEGGSAIEGNYEALLTEVQRGAAALKTGTLKAAYTELDRAHQDKVGSEFMQDDTISVVQVVIAPTHPVADICDYRARANLFGLGPGCYPKAKAPKPTFHPFGRCVVRSRPDLSAVSAREVSGVPLDQVGAD